jgi:hypothetical protein
MTQTAVEETQVAHRATWGHLADTSECTTNPKE